MSKAFCGEVDGVRGVCPGYVEVGAKGGQDESVQFESRRKAELRSEGCMGAG